MNERKDKTVRKKINLQVVINCAILVIAIVFYCIATFLKLSSSMVLTIEIVFLVLMAVISIATILSYARLRDEVNDDAYTRKMILARATRDMRTPMNAIINYSDESLMNNYNPRQIQNAFREVNASGKYMMTLIDDLLALCHVKDKGFKIQEKPHTIIETIENGFAMETEHFEEKNISFNVEYRNIDKFRYVLVDDVRVQQVIMNLLANANKFTPSGGHVELLVEGEELNDDAVRVHIHVKDDGVGMTEHKVKKILSADPKDMGIEGTGMGMAIVNLVVSLLNGKITCHSEVDHGTEFIVTFDWKYTKKNEDENTALDYSILRGKNILLVENNIMNAEITRNILENQGMMMDLASDGKQGVAMFTHAMPHTYDAILMDIRMPVMDGLEATSLIRHSTHPEAKIIPIIAMTADAFDEDRKKTAEAGMNAHITKPIDPDELYLTLTNYIRRN